MKFNEMEADETTIKCLEVAKIMLSHLRHGHSLLGSFKSAVRHVPGADAMFSWISDPAKQVDFFMGSFFEGSPEDEWKWQLALALRPYIEILDYW